MNIKEKETSKGLKMAITFRPFLTNTPDSIDDVNLTVNDMGKSIDKLIDSELEPYKDITTRVNQFLSCLEFEKLTDYQCKVILLLQDTIKKATS